MYTLNDTHCPFTRQMAPIVVHLYVNCAHITQLQGTPRGDCSLVWSAVAHASYKPSESFINRTDSAQLFNNINVNLIEFRQVDGFLSICHMEPVSFDSFLVEQC